MVVTVMHAGVSVWDDSDFSDKPTLSSKSLLAITYALSSSQVKLYFVPMMPLIVN